MFNQKVQDEENNQQSASENLTKMDYQTELEGKSTLRIEKSLNNKDETSDQAQSHVITVRESAKLKKRDGLQCFR